jgi:hypothetical protein
MRKGTCDIYSTIKINTIKEKDKYRLINSDKYIGRVFQYSPRKGSSR